LDDHTGIGGVGLDPEAVKDGVMLLHEVRVIVDPKLPLPSTESDHAVRVPAVEAVIARIEYQ
jgi:hypothetical protein